MISATKPWQLRLTTVMMVTGILVVMLAGLAGCARRDVSTLADRQPSLDLAEFFACLLYTSDAADDMQC